MRQTTDASERVRVTFVYTTGRRDRIHSASLLRLLREFGNFYTSTASSRNSHVPEAVLVRQKADASERVRVTLISTTRRRDRIPQRPDHDALLFD